MNLLRYLRNYMNLNYPVDLYGKYFLIYLFLNKFTTIKLIKNIL